MPAISAVVVAIQMITKYTKKLKYIRKIILVTDAQGSIEADGIEDIASKMKAEGIELMIMYVCTVQKEAYLLTVIAELILMTLNMALRRKRKASKRSLVPAA